MPDCGRVVGIPDKGQAAATPEAGYD